MHNVSFVVIMVVVTALAFDFTNGFHDTANAMATSIATGALKPKVAVTISAILNLVGAMLSTEVAKTVSGGLVDDKKVTAAMIFAGLVGAILWNLLTWLAGLPSSSSHALFGGLIGAVWVGAGSGAVHWDRLIDKILVPAVASPLVAGVAAMAATYIAYRAINHNKKTDVEPMFRRGQVISASMVSLAHGTNDAQKTMGIITLTLIASGTLPAGSSPPLWVILTAGTAIAGGTYIGGWRIIRTMGKGITDVHSPMGFAAETASTAVILASSHMGFALSTTHVCSGGIMGAGAGRKLAEVRWGTARRMVMAWIVTLPSAAIVGAFAASLATRGWFGVVIIAMALIGAAGAIFIISRKNPVDHNNINESHEVKLKGDDAQTPREPALAGV